MTKRKARARLCPDLIMEEMRERRWTLSKLSEESGIERSVLFSVVQAEEFKPLTLNVAEGIGKAFGTSSEFWMNLQKLSEEDYAT